MHAAPVAVGGIGGSGTRLVAQLLRAAGIHMGDDLNAAADTLLFTLLFKRIEILHCDDAQFDLLVQILVSALGGSEPANAAVGPLVRSLSREDRPQHPATWLQQRSESLIAIMQRPRSHSRWGWKEPNTHVVIERLWQRLPDLRYIHVVRHGVDMAFSTNQNQLKLWGPHVLGEGYAVTPSRSLAYWCHVHRHMQELLVANKHRMYWLDYEGLCRDPRAEIVKLCRFLSCDSGSMMPMLAEVRQPSEPRHESNALDEFDAIDLDYVRSLGYMLREVA